MTHKRKKIPQDIMLKLWIKSGGRCEFPGCNKEIWRDGLTLKEDNFAHMAHNVAASPNGPRGDKHLSQKLETKFDNLLLLCLKDSRLVDGKNKSDYSVEQLLKYKQQHEDRIRLQTSLGPECETTVVRFQAPIRERKAPVARAQAYEALEGRYPSDGKGIFFDFSKKAGSGDEAFWTEFAREVAVEVKHALRTGNDDMRYDHLSIFSLAPMPILMHFGNQIGDIVPVELYQKHRDTDNWQWKSDTDTPVKYIYKKPASKKMFNKAALILSLSGTIKPESYIEITNDMPVYEITIKNPNPAFLDTKESLQEFKILYRQVISEIQAVQGSNSKIHLFPAVPAPIAVMCGQLLLPKADPFVVVYDFDHEHDGFIKILTINNHD